MFDDFPASREYVRALTQARLHAVESILAFKARDRAVFGVCATRAKRTIAARLGVGVIDLLRITQSASADRLQLAPGGANGGIPLRLVWEFVLAEETVRYGRPTLRSG